MSCPKNARNAWKALWPLDNLTTVPLTPTAIFGEKGELYFDLQIYKKIIWKIISELIFEYKARQKPMQSFVLSEDVLSKNYPGIQLAQKTFLKKIRIVCRNEVVFYLNFYI